VHGAAPASVAGTAEFSHSETAAWRKSQQRRPSGDLC